MFSTNSLISLAKGSLTQNSPVYVQYYITARCNLTCEQCNIIYANADVEEISLDKIKKIADNFLKMKVAMVLLTGGEPFARKDLPEIIKEFEMRGIHVRMQTNGLASEEQIAKVVEAGGKDISISLDSLNGLLQDKINGGYKKSWDKAINSIVNFSKYLPKKNSFASLGCVMSKNNLDDIKDVIEFGTKISWHTSLVPIHITEQSAPKGFRTFDKSLKFNENEIEKAVKLIDEIREMRNNHYLLYDSDQYLDDIKKFISGKEITWRDKNQKICDSPNLYFALLPNGEFAPCCDYRLSNEYFAYDDNFPKIYKEQNFRKEVKSLVSKCDGCMYGSYPEISISMRFLKAKIQRAKTFFINPPKKRWPLTKDDVLQIVEEILQNKNAQKNKI